MNKTVASASLLLAWAAAPAPAQDDFLPAAALTDVGLVKFWQLQLPLESDQHLVDGFRVDEAIYFTTNDGYVFAVHAYTGAIRWLRQITGADYRLRAPCHAGDHTIFVTPTRAVLYDRISGKAFYDLELSTPAGSSGATDGFRWMFGGVNQRFYAFDVQGGYEVWKATTNGPIDSTPVVRRDYVFFASGDGGVYSCTSADKRFHWQASTNGPNTADLVADDNGVYVASRDQSLYLFDLQFGQPRWRVRFGGPLFEPPVITPKVAYQYCPDDGVVAINVETADSNERLRWKLPQGRALLAVYEKRAFLQSRDESLIVIDEATGEIERSIPTPGFAIGMPAPGDIAVYLAGSDGRVFCARPKGAPFARRDDLRRALLPPGAAASQPAATQSIARRPAVPGLDLEPRRAGAVIGARSQISRAMLGEKGGGPARRPGRSTDEPAPADDPDQPATDKPTSQPTSQPADDDSEESAEPDPG